MALFMLRLLTGSTEQPEAILNIPCRICAVAPSLMQGIDNDEGNPCIPPEYGRKLPDCLKVVFPRKQLSDHHGKPCQEVLTALEHVQCS